MATGEGTDSTPDPYWGAPDIWRVALLPPCLLSLSPAPSQAAGGQAPAEGLNPEGPICVQSARLGLAVCARGKRDGELEVDRGFSLANTGRLEASSLCRAPPALRPRPRPQRLGIQREVPSPATVPTCSLRTPRLGAWLWEACMGKEGAYSLNLG